jgi:AcrR family transcriptional regulator
MSPRGLQEFEGAGLRQMDGRLMTSELEPSAGGDPERSAKPRTPRGPAKGTTDDDRPWAPRRPTQERSRRRYEAILRAAEELLETANLEDISFYDLARKAGMPAASVHYLFPSAAAIQSELRERHDTRISEHLLAFHAEMAGRSVATWQEWLRIEAAEARDYYNANRPACEILLGPLLHRENRTASMRGNAQVGASNLENMKRRFLVPDTPGLEARFARNCAIIEMFWSTSYLATGSISDFAFEESVRAGVSYLLNFLPGVLAVRPEPELSA